MGESRQPLRKEDNRLIKGKGLFVDDLTFTNMLHCSFVRSTQSHAYITSIDIDQASKTEGVVGVYLAKDLDVDLEGVPMFWPIEGLKNPGQPLLAIDKVHYYGEPVAIVIAESKEVASCASNLIEVTYETLPSVTSLQHALKKSNPYPIHNNIPNNIAYEWERTFGDPENLMGEKESVSQRLVIPRVAPLPMETRGVVAKYDARTEMLEVWSSTQFPHPVRLALSSVVKHPENLIQVSAPDVGGAFGCKMNVYREEILVAYFAKKLCSAIKYIESRSEHFVATTHGRDQIQDVTAHYNKDGKVLGLDITIHGNMGAFLQAATPGIPLFTTQMLSGCYDIGYIKVKVIGHYTNQTPTDAYRGAGRPEATYLVERVMDIVALKTRKKPEDVRLLNFIKKEEFPKQVVTGMLYDSGDYELALKVAMNKASIEEWRLKKEANQRMQDRKQIGIGICSYVEFCGNGPSDKIGKLGLMASGHESAVVRVHPSGSVTVISGTCPSGQGHHTSWSHLVEENLGIPSHNIHVVTGSTVNTPWGGGTSGSRSAAVGGTAIYQACQKIIEKGKLFLSKYWALNVEDIYFQNGIYTSSSLQTMSIQELAGKLYLAHELPKGIEPGLEVTVFYEPSNFTFPFGCHICIVEVDTWTGHLKILKYVAVDDCGNVIHEKIAEGQIRGGIVQGIGQALYEEVDQRTGNGEINTSSFRNYYIPRAIDIPDIIFERTCTPSPVNPLGVKGVGESGTIGSTPAVVNAVVDALNQFGIANINPPANPKKIWSSLRGVHPYDFNKIYSS
ncbi:xanthine dehydrogenase family protein molybdopterin-binding subunit [Priestia koreensis]|uniref:xanthine dehydrogenase family protein molybdopterin-binding subunit n=1 Tax=Priestia koreensis TaxID=284581 RepID=UPI003CFD974C